MGLKVWSSWGPGGRKPKSPYYGGFFFYHAKSRHRSSVFLRPNFMVHFFLFRINFKGISYIKLKAISIFW